MINATPIPADGPEILCGHRVLEDEQRPPFGPDALDAVTADALRRFLDRNRDRPVAALTGLSRRIDPAALILTFDDGFADFPRTVLPILEEYEAPATLFVTTGFVDGRRVPYERLLAGFLLMAPERIVLDGHEVVFENMAARAAAYERLRLSVKKASERARRRLVNRVAAACGLQLDDVPVPAPLTTEDIRRLAAHDLVSLGAHSIGHGALDSMLPLAAWSEISGSRRALEAMSGQAVDAFAYPYGAHTALVRRLVASAGFRLALGTEPRRVRPADVRRPWCIPRRDLAGIVS